MRSIQLVKYLSNLQGKFSTYKLYGQLILQIAKMRNMCQLIK